ncbi:MAG: aldehyde dehydrogenase [Actinobacteria bacterium]|nr:aldehyde dehydrogenase [Actinomycetota bacterium]
MSATQQEPGTAYGLYIDGQHVQARTGETMTSVNPATGRPWYTLANAGAEDVDAAVRSARAALSAREWRDMKPLDRARLLRRVADGVARRADQLAVLETTDNGKLIREMRAQMRALPSLWEYYAGWADKVHGSVVPTDPATLTYLRREPVGVVAVVVPWNSPLAIASTKIAPALATGNTVVVKPSEHTTASMMEFVAILEEAGLPAGVVNVVTGAGSSAGHALVAHPDVDLITFTGGTETGRAIARIAADRPIRSVLELGGKSPNIVFADADLDRALPGLVAGIFAACGQTCVAGSRAFVQRPIYDEVLSRLEERTRRMRLGDPLSEDTDIGPVAFEGQMARVLEYIDVGRHDGGTVRVGGARAVDGDLADGYFVEPTIFEGVRNDSRLAREEVFGPVLAVMPFDDDDDVVAAANDSLFGLAAGVWTTSLSRAHRMAHRLDAGTVWVNTYRALSPTTPFGGFKASGYGKESGQESIAEYTRVKTVWLDLSDDAPADALVMRR